MSLVQTTKFYLIYRDENEMEYGEFCNRLREFQNQIRAFKNMASIEYFGYIMKQSKMKDELGKWPKDEEVLGYKMRNHLYNKATEMIPGLSCGNCSSISEALNHYFVSHKTAILSGREAIPSYRSNQPIDIRNDAIRIYEEDGKIYLSLSLFSNAGKKQFGIQNGRVRFEAWHKCESSLAILGRCLLGEYHARSGKLQYDDRKKMWEFALSYSFVQKENTLDQDRILGIDLGVTLPFVAVVSHEDVGYDPGINEIQAFRAKTEARRRQLLRARPFAGNGSVGHGISCRTKPAYRIGRSIANFRDSKNDGWSRKIVEIALKHRCGTIQMEDLSGISGGKQPRFLKNWTYYDLQQKIKYKADAVGINVVFVNPKYTSQRCSCCGCIDKDNRKTQAEFVCQQCGHTENADYNAARNLSVKNIDTIIKSACEGEANIKTA